LLDALYLQLLFTHAPFF